MLHVERTADGVAVRVHDRHIPGATADEGPRDVWTVSIPEECASSVMELQLDDIAANINELLFLRSATHWSAYVRVELDDDSWANIVIVPNGDISSTRVATFFDCIVQHSQIHPISGWHDPMILSDQEDATTWPPSICVESEKYFESSCTLRTLLNEAWRIVDELAAIGTESLMEKRMPWDVFISHASEDKDTIARPLAASLRAAGLRVWFDETELRLGDSLRRSIDNGLAQCRYGVVIISPSFLRKEWPQRELDGLTAREIGSRKVILPIWHDVSFADVARYSPVLADRLAVRSELGLTQVVVAITSLMD
jgi:hypothetical protein